MNQWMSHESVSQSVTQVVTEELSYNFSAVSNLTQCISYWVTDLASESVDETLGYTSDREWQLCQSVSDSVGHFFNEATEM
jgi:hypothetical protein